MEIYKLYYCKYCDHTYIKHNYITHLETRKHNNNTKSYKIKKYIYSIYNHESEGISTDGTESRIRKI